ncbi:isoflavone reductase [Colletotrichum paranaense]|uniref:Isoflavone reductase n=1 Tax=Colletotrichum paranaense TaxID=1914294 RepID=A0ABQ9T4Q4_9PEZI|nr:isoflavone reductase [Colletotrichum paranaense]KAK1546766.1 isoflavone reductase [Colletotrichum paranaense]
MKVALIGGTGETGSIIVNALLESDIPALKIIAIVRPASERKPDVVALEKRGVAVAVVDLEGPRAELVIVLEGADVLISTIHVSALGSQIPLADAAKAAGVKRFVPCFFATVAPAKGVLTLRQLKEEALLHAKKIRLPYTVIDVGWWYQLSIPRLPSGRIDSATPLPVNFIAGDGNTLSALTDVRDVGRFTARIIADPRTINKMMSAEAMENAIAAESLTADAIEKSAFDNRMKIFYEYWYSMGVRGDNTPEYAEFLGYVDGTKLYPDFQPITFEAFLKEVLDGKSVAIYRTLEKNVAKAEKKAKA